MVEIIVKTFKNNIANIYNIINGIDDSQLYLQTNQFKPDTICHPIWTLGHLIGSTMGMREEMYEVLDKSKENYEKWSEKYGQNSNPISDPTFYHGKDELRDLLGYQVDAMEKRIKSLTKAQLDGPMVDKRYWHIFPSLFHVCSKIFIEHSAEHVKMLSVWKHYVLGDV